MRLDGFGAVKASMSLPSRGAWIEIALKGISDAKDAVAPLAGSVDRNQSAVEKALEECGRSPRGERG